MFPKNVYVDTGPSAETRAQSALRMVVPPMDPLLGSKPLFGGTDSQRPRRSSPVTLTGPRLIPLHIHRGRAIFSYNRCSHFSAPSMSRLACLARYHRSSSFTVYSYIPFELLSDILGPTHFQSVFLRRTIASPKTFVRKNHAVRKYRNSNSK